MPPLLPSRREHSEFTQRQLVEATVLRHHAGTAADSVLPLRGVDQLMGGVPPNFRHNGPSGGTFVGLFIFFVLAIIGLVYILPVLG